eukprot:TRINITY_DN3465_c1_g2_i2.p1 TRINITY_DN3465_c1_g2~~TRINITY_DN3465_c1_g2_i2.p1  ORF type:complete len:265 (-),score=-4.18 TRINITY_DN3465_c1_g2_i2:10-804(-)
MLHFLVLNGFFLPLFSSFLRAILIQKYFLFWFLKKCYQEQYLISQCVGQLLLGNFFQCIIFVQFSIQFSDFLVLQFLVDFWVKNNSKKQVKEFVLNIVKKLLWLKTLESSFENFFQLYNNYGNLYKKININKQRELIIIYKIFRKICNEIEEIRNHLNCIWIQISDQQTQKSDQKVFLKQRNFFLRSKFFIYFYQLKNTKKKIYIVFWFILCERCLTTGNSNIKETYLFFFFRQIINRQTSCNYDPSTIIFKFSLQLFFVFFYV